MNKYETLYIITPELDEETTKGVIEKFSALTASNGGEVDKIDEWGNAGLRI